MMFSVPMNKLEGFIADFRRAQEGNWGYTRSNLVMRPDFPQPDIYKKVFRDWGLDVED